MWHFIQKHKSRQRLAELTELCSFPKTLDLARAQRVLVFAPHPDDETIWCGGTLQRLVQLCPVKVVLVTDGSGAGELPPGTAERRQEEFKRAVAVLGVQDIALLQQPDGALTASPPLERQLRQLIHDYCPNWVFLPSPLDRHRDHLRLAAMLEPICRKATCVEQLLYYEGWNPVPATHLVDITGQAACKQAALSEHVTALGCADYARAVEGLNRYWGIFFGRNRLAEAFLVESTRRPGSFWQLLQMGLQLRGKEVI